VVLIVLVQVAAVVLVVVVVVVVVAVVEVPRTSAGWKDQHPSRLQRLPVKSAASAPLHAKQRVDQPLQPVLGFR
jgi:hypothetical protein